MSYITAMAVNEGVIMAADRQSMIAGTDRASTKSMRKLYTIGDNIGLNFSGVAGFSNYIEQFCKTYRFYEVEAAAKEFLSFIYKSLGEIPP